MFRTSEGGSRRQTGIRARCRRLACGRRYQRSYFAPALFSLVPVATDLIGSMAVDSHWRLYYNDAWVATHTVEENATPAHSRGGPSAARPRGAQEGRGHHGPPALEHRRRLRDQRRSPRRGTAAARRSAAARQVWAAEWGHRRESTTSSCRRRPARIDSDAADAGDQSWRDCGSGAHGERRFWELPADDEHEGGVPGVDRLKAELVRREVARLIDRDVAVRWRRSSELAPLGTRDARAEGRLHGDHPSRGAQGIARQHARPLRPHLRRPHRRQACYGEFIMASFYQPRPRPGFLIDTSSSMEDSQLARAVSELGGLTRQLGYGADVVVACCDAAVHDVRKVFTVRRSSCTAAAARTWASGCAAFIERKGAPIDLLVIVSDCRTPWPRKCRRFR